jgi:hypothetical protein
MFYSIKKWRYNINLKHQADKLYSKLIEEEGKFYRKRRVYPYLNREGKVNWFNALTGGTWLKLGILISIIFLILLMLYDWSNAIKVGNECLNQTIKLPQLNHTLYLR